MAKEQPQTSQLVLVHQNLNKLLQEKAKALPKNFNQTRFLQNCMTVLQDVKGIEKVQPISVARTMLKGAFLGLDFFRKECYAIPYGDQLNFQTDYKGEIKLAKKYSLKEIHDVYAKLVREGDIFQEAVQGGQQVINFTPKPFNDGKIIGAFAVCYYADKTMLYETMSLTEIDHVRKTYSKMPDGKAWKDSFGEMAKKTVLRRLCKLIEIDFENTDQDEAYEAGGDVTFADAEVIEPIKMPEPVKPSQNGEEQAPPVNPEFKAATPVQIATLQRATAILPPMDDMTMAKWERFNAIPDAQKSFADADDWIKYFKEKK